MTWKILCDLSCSNQHQAHAVRPQEFGFKLSDVFDYYAEAMEWKDAYHRHKCSVMVSKFVLMSAITIPLFTILPDILDTFLPLKLLILNFKLNKSIASSIGDYY